MAWEIFYLNQLETYQNIFHTILFNFEIQLIFSLWEKEEWMGGQRWEQIVEAPMVGQLAPGGQKMKDQLSKGIYHLWIINYIIQEIMYAINIWALCFIYGQWTYNCSIRWLSTFEVSECFRLFRLEMVMVIANGQACPGWLNLPRERAGRPQGTASQQVTETELRRWRAESLKTTFPCSHVQGTFCLVPIWQSGQICRPWGSGAIFAGKIGMRSTF